MHFPWKWECGLNLIYSRYYFGQKFGYRRVSQLVTHQYNYHCAEGQNKQPSIPHLPIFTTYKFLPYPQKLYVLLAFTISATLIHPFVVFEPVNSVWISHWRQPRVRPASNLEKRRPIRTFEIGLRSLSRIRTKFWPLAQLSVGYRSNGVTWDAR